MKKFYLVLCAVFLIAVLPQARAATCNVTNTGTAFGVYTPTSATNVTTMGTITVNCTGAIAETIIVTVTLNPGVNGTFSGRKMKSGSSLLTYNLYLDPTLLLVWGDLSLGTLTVVDTYILLSTSISKQYTVYGLLNGSQTTATPGSYLDSVTVTLNY